MKKLLSLFFVFVLVFTVALYALFPVEQADAVIKSAEISSVESSSYDVSQPAYYLSALSMQTDINAYFGALVDSGSNSEAELTGDNQITYPGLGVYEGEHKNLVRNGTGTFTWEDGNVYVGSWVNDEISGYGELTYPKVGTYKGNYKESKRNGEGTFTWDVGDSYVGSWVDDQMSGNGTYTFADGVVIQGTFEANRIISGSYSYEMPTSKYGMYHHDDLVYWNCDISSGTAGNITFKCKGGITYTGAYSTLTGTGTAKITYSDGSIYEGQVSCCKRSGTGKMTWYSSSTKAVKAIYNGSWANDTMNGTGNYYFSSSSYPYLTGTFKDGKPQGTCVYYKEADNTFDTVWANGYCTEVKES